MNDYKGDERREIELVRDSSAVAGINTGNVLTAATILVLGWIGMNTAQSTKDIASIKGSLDVQQVQIIHNKETLDRHIDNKNAHQ